MMQCLSAICVLGIIGVALLLTTSIIRPEQALAALGRGFVVLVLILSAICTMKALIVAVLPALKVAAHWTGILALASAGFALVAAIALRFAKRFSHNIRHKRGQHETDEG